jgi:hypothetical protein
MEEIHETGSTLGLRDPDEKYVAGCMTGLFRKFHILQLSVDPPDWLHESKLFPSTFLFARNVKLNQANHQIDQHF